MTFMKEGAGLINRPTTELSELGNGIAMVEAFSHVVVFKTGDGLVLFDTSLEAFGGGVLKSLRGWTDEPVSHICYTHGLPIAGKARIAGVLDAIATALEMLVEQTVAMMNEGARLDEIVHAVKLPSELMNKPYLRPVYDEPEFVIHNIWRLYGGWYDGNPAHLKPSPDAVLAAEMASLAGGADKLAKRAAEVAQAGDLRLACHLAEMAVQADPESVVAHGVRAEVFGARRKAEASLMAKGIYGFAERQSLQVLGKHNQK